MSHKFCAHAWQDKSLEGRLLAACKVALPALEVAIPWATGTTQHEQKDNRIIRQLREAIAAAEANPAV